MRTLAASIALGCVLAVAGLTPTHALAQEPPAVAPEPVAPAVPIVAETVPAPAPMKHWVLHFNFAVMLASWRGATGNGMGGNAEGWRDITNRGTLGQFFGIGYFFDPRFRVTASFLLAETVAGLRAANTGATPPVTAEGPFTSGSLVLWAAYHPVPWLFVGAGPILAARAYDAWQFDVGVLVCAGAAAALGNGFSLGGVLQSPFMFGIRPAWTLAAAVTLAYRF